MNNGKRQNNESRIDQEAEKSFFPDPEKEERCQDIGV
jgi:hypothetical protein